MNYERKRFGIVRKMMMDCELSDKKVLDLGSGEPSVTDGMKASMIVKIDSNPNTNPDVVHDLTKKLPFGDDEFDMVVACEIMEHLVDTGFFLKEIKRVLKPLGCLIISIPNICSLKYRFAFLLGKIPAHACKVNGEHVRDFNKDDLIGELERNGFVVPDVKTDGIWLGNGARLFLSVGLGDSIIVKVTNIKKRR